MKSISMLQPITLFLSNKLKGLKSRLEIYSLPNTKSCSVHGQIILLRLDSQKELKRAKTYSTKEPNTLDWLDEAIKEGDVYYDIGANIGLYSLYPAIKLSGKCHIYAFEPEALNFAKLNININLNSLSGCIKSYPVALNSKNSVTDFYLNRFGYGEALHQLGRKLNNMNQTFNPVHTQGAIGMTLDSLVYEYGLPCPNHIKIDVDGLERDVVSGGKRVFSSAEVRSVLVEVSKPVDGVSEEEWFIEFFSNCGFSLASYPDKRSRTENLIFKRP